MSSTDLPSPPDGRDPRDIVTPYAFQVSPRVLGLPLASPARRLAAAGIDGLAVAMLSKAPGALLMLFASIVLLRWAGQPDLRGVTAGRRVVRWSGAALAVLALWSLYGFATDLAKGTRRVGDDVAATTGLAGLAIEIENKECADERCARGPLLEFAELAGRNGWSDAKARDAVADVLAKLPVDDARRDALRAGYLERVAEARKEAGADDAERFPGEAGIVALDADEEDDEPEPRKPVYSVIEWAKGLLDDLGIGLGWAALYFSVFCAWWNGQTPGKKLLGIRVVQLDATPMSLWESFERYGGYGAGFATGLLGFLQVFWDANRQAIHDKICETVVIRGDLPPSASPAPP